MATTPHHPGRPAWLLIAMLTGLIFPHPLGAQEESTAGDQPPLPYMRTDHGRASHPYSDAQVNKHRLYDFYSRQAAYYLDGHEVPDILPAFPGVDGGKFGHWGAESSSKNNFNSDRWDEMDMGPVVSGVFRHGQKPAVLKSISARLGPSGNLAICFDPQTLSYRELWTGGFLRHDTFRWGLISGVHLDGQPLLTTVPSIGWSSDGRWPASYQQNTAHFRGYHRHGNRVVFSYKHDGLAILDAPWALDTANAGPILTRTVRLANAVNRRYLQLFQGRSHRSERQRSGRLDILTVHHPDGATLYALRTEALTGNARLIQTDDNRIAIELENVAPASRFTIYTWTGSADGIETALTAIRQSPKPRDPASLTQPGPSQWTRTLTLAGELAEQDHGAYAIDRIPVPLENPYKSLMFLSGIDFYDNGDAAICTMTGDVWRISGLDDNLQSVRWQRIAAGLNHAQGLVIVNNTPAVINRGRITLLHDTNADNTADFYENFASDFPTATGHNFNTGLQRDAAGNFYFASQVPGPMRVSPNGQRVDVLATGLRNPNGVGVRSDGLAVSSAQEGTWTPTSMIAEISSGGFFGMGAQPGQNIDPPLCFVPRGVDASTGGQLFVEDDRFGPLSGQLLSFGWNYANHYAVLLDQVDGVRQAAAVPLPGDFRAGAHRARIRPHDGHLYVACSDGWGTYALQHGALHRIRYTGEKAYLPTAFHAHRNGLRITFSQPLAPSAAANPDRYFAQQWNYIYSSNYGSKEYSVRQPDQVGHDPLNIRSAHLLDDGRSVFLEIPRIRPVMQMHLHARLTAADGHRFSADLFPTIHRMDEPFTDFPGYQPPPPDKPKQLQLRIQWPKPQQPDNPAPQNDPQPAPDRSFTIRAIPGLSYDTQQLRVEPGQRIALTLQNTDVMPHNLVLIRPGRTQAIGRAADRMISQADAADRHYVPPSDDVITHTPIVQPDQSHTIRFTAPEQAGRYPYICTFPGHWRAMRGTLIVENP